MTTTTATANPAQSLYASLGQRTDTKATTVDDAQSRFLTLLTTQLQNQDPLNPMDNAEVTSQLAQISTVDGIERLNASLQKLLDGTTDAQALQAASLVGRGVLVPGTALQLTQGASFGGIELTGSADEVTVAIKDANGLVMRTINLGALPEGVHPFAWDGKTDNGTPAADGNYSMSISAERGGEAVTASALALGQVSSITRGGQGMTINVGALGVFTMADIKEIL
ncbi:MAG: flagellar hook assembly protein FlgD [Gammaproteobacteria bacterium]|nr:flagellar hook assembly protein FlgD [Gammaproteobacteria bacterium]MBU1646170.1 flagellar hook assembly protein FlgD [Gammaproteobacteria bacterium]MBU1972232.1 flagellar hook assembly protein FlgD [Gammaproteobacteria bacterium]